MIKEMIERRKQIIKSIENLIKARDIIFTEIVNLSMLGEMNHFESVFDIGDEYSFVLSHFEDVRDENVRKLVELCKKNEEIVFSIMNLNGINENEVNL